MDFRNSKGYGSSILRIKEDETPDEAIERLKADGWIIENYQITEDPNGHPIIIPKSGLLKETKEPEPDAGD